MSRPQLACGKCQTPLTWDGEPFWFRCVLPAGTPHPHCNCDANHVFLLCAQCLREETVYVKDGDGFGWYELRGPYGGNEAVNQ